MAGMTTRYYSLTGGLNTSMGLGTINSSTRGTETPDCYNVESYKLSGLKSMEGNKQFANTLPSPITLGHEYRKESDKFMVVTTSDGSVWCYDNISNTFENVYTFPTATQRHSACNFNQGVVISNGVDDLVYYNRGRNTKLDGTVSIASGSTTVTGTDTEFTKDIQVGDYIRFEDETPYKVEEIVSDTELRISTPVSSPVEISFVYLTPISELNARLINSDDPTVDYEIRGLALNSYQGRLFVGGNDGNLYYSELGLIHGWDVKYGAGAIPPFYNDNSDFTALGIYGNYLIIHKRDYTYYLDGRNEPTSWEITPYADLSCDSQQSWVGANTGYYVFSRKAGGIYPLMSRTAFINNYLGKEISEKIRESFVNINSALYDQIYPVYHPSKKYLMFYMPMLQGNGGSNYCFIYDFISKAWWLRIVPQQVTGAFVFDSKVYITTRSGKVLQEFKTLTFDGDVISFSWRSPWFQYGDGTNYLSSREFRVKISEEYTNNFYVRNRRDGYDDYHERHVTNDKEAFEALEWSDDAGLITETVWDEYDWVETGYLIKRFPLPDQFFTSQQIEFYGSVKDEAMCILGFEVDRIEREDNPW